MSPDPVDPEVLAAQARNAPLTRPRPGHADLAGMQKYGPTDARAILERASARETAARVALGEVARAFLRQALGAEICQSRGRARRGRGRPTSGGAGAARPGEHRRRPGALRRPAASAAMIAEVDAARKDGDTLGGVVEVVVYGLPPGLGSSRALGPAAGRPAGRRADEHPGDQGRRGRRRVRHRGPARLARRTTRSYRGRTACAGGTNRAGGIEGGMSTGEVLRVRAAMKPISTVPRALETIDVPPASPPRRSTSAATSPRSGRRAWSPRRWWRWCWPRRRRRSSAATRWTSCAGTRRATSSRW